MILLVTTIIVIPHGRRKLCYEPAGNKEAEKKDKTGCSGYFVLVTFIR